MKKLPVAITSEEFVELIKATKKEKHKVAFLLGFGSGLRISEIINLKPENIDIKNKSIIVVQGKGKKDRVAPLAKGFKEKHLSLFPMKYKNIRAGSKSLQVAFKSAAKNSGLLEKKPTAHFHSLRHGFATNCIKNGMPINYLKALLGHSNISVTNVYLEANPKDALKSYEELF